MLANILPGWQSLAAVTAIGYWLNAAIVVVGVIGGLIGALALAYNIRKDTLTGQAEASRLAAIHARADHATERATQAIADAERERLARLEIEQRLAPRALSDAQIEAIAAKLRVFSGLAEYTITTFWDLQEPVALSTRIHEALQASGWNYTKSEGFLLGGLAGVHVWTHPDATMEVKEAATALIEALNSAGIAAVPRQQNPVNPIDTKIGINVGTKT
jgi:hypothetical protein